MVVLLQISRSRIPIDIDSPFNQPFVGRGRGEGQVAGVSVLGFSIQCMGSSEVMVPRISRRTISRTSRKVCYLNDLISPRGTERIRSSRLRSVKIFYFQVYEINNTSKLEFLFDSICNASWKLYLQNKVLINIKTRLIKQNVYKHTETKTSSKISN